MDDGWGGPDVLTSDVLFEISDLAVGADLEPPGEVSWLVCLADPLRDSCLTVSGAAVGRLVPGAQDWRTEERASEVVALFPPGLVKAVPIPQVPGEEPI